jgi:mannose-1-phosphate guanylyltransferase
VDWVRLTGLCLWSMLRVLTRPIIVLTEQVTGGIVVPGSGRLVACLGVDDLVIVDMPDTLLVTTRARSQKVKRLVKKAKV